NQRLLWATFGVDPVDADHSSPGPGLDELVGSCAAIAGPLLDLQPLELEDRPGLIRALSPKSVSPPQEAALDAAPDRLGCEEPEERLEITVVRGFVALFQLL